MKFNRLTFENSRNREFSFFILFISSLRLRFSRRILTNFRNRKAVMSKGASLSKFFFKTLIDFYNQVFGWDPIFVNETFEPNQIGIKSLLAFVTLTAVKVFNTFNLIIEVIIIAVIYFRVWGQMCASH